MEKVSFECWEMRFRFIRMTIRPNFLAVVIFYPITSCLVSIRNFFFSSFNFLLLDLFNKICSKIFSTLFFPTHAYIYIYIYTERLVRMAKKEKQKFCQYRAEMGSQTTSTSSPSPACLVALLNYLIAFIMKSSINVSMVRASTYFKEG